MSLQNYSGQDAPMSGLEEPQPFDAAARRQEMEQTLTGSDEIDALVSQICVGQTQSILSFGSDAAGQVARCSDDLLRSAGMYQAGDSGPLLAALSRVMDQFDPEDFGIEEPKKGVFSKLFPGRKKDPDQLLSKYHDMGGAVDKLYVELKKYEADIAALNRGLQAMLDANINCYQELVRYVLAGEQGLREMEDYLAQMRPALARCPENGILQADCGAMEQAHTLLERRVQDLRIAEVVALQAIPMLQTMQGNNRKLVQKIHSAFLVTLPVFKQAMAQAVQMKRQRLQAQAMRALDERTADLLRRNEQTAAQTETMRQAWQTIVNGIEETKALQTDAGTQRTADAARLNDLRQELQGHL